MKKCWIIVLLALLMVGCSPQETFEVVNDIYDLEVIAPAYQLQFELPGEAAVPSMENESGGSIYLCDGYTLTVQTMQAGSLDRTLRELTGFDSSRLSVMETKQGGFARYDYVWSSAGEGGDHVGRGAILDDGNYHYAVTVMADSATAGTLSATWKKILTSVTLADID